MAQWDDTDWYRSSRWDGDVAKAFEARLGRARLRSRAQYVRIQASHLTAQPDRATREAGRVLFQRVLADFQELDPRQAQMASEELGRSWAQDGRFDEAEKEYRHTLSMTGTLVGERELTDGLVPLFLAEVLFMQRRRLSEADTLLDRVEGEVRARGGVFRIVEFRFLLARARVCAALGDKRAAGYAARALEVADEPEPTEDSRSDLNLPKAQDHHRAELLAIIAGRPTTD